MTLLSSPPLCIFLQFFLDALLEEDALFFSWEFVIMALLHDMAD